MVNEFFLEQCLDACCSLEKDYEYSKEIFASIFSVLNWYNKQVPVEARPLKYRAKMDLAFLLAKERVSNYDFNLNEFIDKISGGVYKEFIPVLESKKNILTDERKEKLLKIILKKREICEIVKNKISFQTLLEDIDQENFEKYDDLIVRWKDNIMETYNNILSIKKLESIREAASVNLMEDDIAPIINKYVESYKSSKVTKTGISELDACFPLKGLEKRRVYIFGGETAAGKSTLLINIICNSIKENKSDNLETYIYFTAENLLDETLLRFYCTMKDYSYAELSSSILSNPTTHLRMQEEIREYLKQHNANVIFLYVERKQTSLLDLENILDEYSSKGPIKAVFVDYLDLISSGKQINELRHELAAVTCGFKQLAIRYDVCWVTATQLNKTGYNGQVPSITSIKESMAKAEDSDFVALLQLPSEPDNFIKYNTDSGIITAKVINISIVKQRNGLSGQRFKLVLNTSLDGYDCFSYKLMKFPEITDDKIVEEDYTDSL